MLNMLMPFLLGCGDSDLLACLCEGPHMCGLSLAHLALLWLRQAADSSHFMPVQASIAVGSWAQGAKLTPLYQWRRHPGAPSRRCRREGGIPAALTSQGRPPASVSLLCLALRALSLFCLCVLYRASQTSANCKATAFTERLFIGIVLLVYFLHRPISCKSDMRFNPGSLFKDVNSCCR